MRGFKLSVLKGWLQKSVRRGETGLALLPARELQTPPLAGATVDTAGPAGRVHTRGLAEKLSARDQYVAVVKNCDPKPSDWKKQVKNNTDASECGAPAV